MPTCVSARTESLWRWRCCLAGDMVRLLAMGLGPRALALFWRCGASKAALRGREEAPASTNRKRTCQGQHNIDAKPYSIIVMHSACQAAMPQSPDVPLI